MLRRIVLTIALAASLCLAATTAAQDEWTQWRGPHRDGTVDRPAWPESLGPTSLIAVWTKPLGPSYSGPIVAGDRVFVTETVDEKDEVVTALSRDSGEVIWTQSWPGAMSVPFFAKANGDWIRATPAFDGATLYVAGMRDVLVALDGDTGEVKWRRDFVAELGTDLPDFGCSSSPLVDGDSLYVQAGLSVMRLDAATGETVWRALVAGDGMNGGAFSSPVIREVAGVRQLIVQTRDELVGLVPESGEILWRQTVPTFRGMNILTPTIYRDGIFTATYQGGSFFFNVSSQAGELSASETWKDNVQGYMSSPVVVGDHAYVHLRNRRATCFDLKTGERTWTSEPFGEYWSMAAAGDRILVLDEEGELLLIAADPSEFRLLDRRKISDSPAWAYLAPAGDELYVRSLDALHKFLWVKN